MARADRLAFLQVDIGLLNISEPQKKYLCTLIDTSEAMITRRGVHLLDHDSADDALVAQIAGWMYRARGKTEQAVLPDYLRRQINDRLVQQKMGDAAE